jgi:hypothetical protein
MALVYTRIAWQKSPLRKLSNSLLDNLEYASILAWSEALGFSRGIAIIGARTTCTNYRTSARIMGLQLEPSFLTDLQGGKVALASPFSPLQPRTDYAS